MSGDKKQAKSGPNGQRMARWKVMLVVMSVLFMVAGLVIRVYAHVNAPKPAAETGAPAASTASAVASAARSLLPGSTGPRVPAPGSGDAAQGAEAASVPGPLGIDMAEWSPTIFRFGFSFFAGFCIAFALRTFFRVGMMGIGLALLLLFGLEYAGMVRVDWVAFSHRYDSATQWLAHQTGSFRQFVTGQLPSAGMALLGIFTGIRKG